MSSKQEFSNATMFSVDELCFSPIRNLDIRLILYTLIVLLILITLSGNLLVVISIAYFKQLRSSTNCFILSLAVADFLVGVAVMPYSMIRTIEGCWYFGTIFCRFHSSLDVMFCTASILHLSCIAFDRYYAVCNPLLYGYKMSSQRVTALIATCWVVPLLISFGPIMLGVHTLGIESGQQDGVCDFLVNKVYAVCASLVAFYLPMFLMLAAYWKIYKVARKQALQIHAVEKHTSKPSDKDDTKRKPRRSMKHERKAAKTLGVIIGIFLAFWAPFFTANIIDPFIGYRTGTVEWEVFLWLGYVNSAMNPVLYGLFHRSFRRAFLIVIGCNICMARSTPNTDLSNEK
ncbi:5-hydroxytryptamine receptor 4-like [Pleurodeles waltl]|uniref:5-hydroxytryptamine receptor 4-like n=1 Tax=Pleurodeles waltl TaxID=8319 RepID=UPI0037096A18